MADTLLRDMVCVELGSELRYMSHAQDLEPAQRDSWTGTVRGPTPAYAWLQCNEVRDQDCYQAMADVGIMGRSGPAFGAGPDYNRLELLMQPAVFESLAAKLQLFMTS